MSFIDDAIDVLENIERTPSQLTWCRQYSVYANDSNQSEVYRKLQGLYRKTYDINLVITNYNDIIEAQGLAEEKISEADADWLSSLSLDELLACLAYHFRRDHFCEGALIADSIASGAMLRILKQLRAYEGKWSPAVSMETLHRTACSDVPDKPGIYCVVVPENFVVEFDSSPANLSDEVYSVQTLIDKYNECIDKHIVYIGKANGRRGLNQRLKQYVKYGWNESTNHKGGRAVWQIKNSGELLVKYQCCTANEQLEHLLLADYRDKNGSYPLANWRG